MFVGGGGEARGGGSCSGQNEAKLGALFMAMKRFWRRNYAA